MTNKQNIIHLILGLPREFNNQKDKSFKQLLEETGYFEVRNQIQKKDILEIIKKCPEFIKDWFTWSENKRVTSGWFLKEEKEKYVVSFFPNSKTKKTFRTKSIQKASAYFIKQELDDIK
tara:strand:+ start:80 stop:436 length:357 start_codon:yes stop_codon:yes gene_type:complete